ncbi:lipase family alpha/beta hydrolase [Speluncibacter jeojiensis]|uniref:Lipase family protein n=1 Tax=Speluncibacter jeojiensis TaxID=2710754 RepID=A0A9X4M422_9ACTN|nr:lipase family protein [Corynebacteriales bacterium D3-21]
MFRTSAVTVAVLAGVLLGGALPAAAAPAPPSIPYSYLAGLAAQAVSPGQAPPGADDWSCRPTSAHPDPVILLHGFVSTGALTWQTLSPLLAGHGYCVFTLDYGVDPVTGVGGLGRIDDSADQLADFIGRVRSATGAARVDLVGHSEGATMPFAYLARHDGVEHAVRRYVSLAALDRGTTQDGLAPLIRAALAVPGVGAPVTEHCGPCSELLAGSQFLVDLDPHGWRYPDIAFTNIVTRDDEIATPYTTGLLDGPNVTNIVVQERCPADHADHLELPSDPVATALVLTALDPDHPATPTCRAVLPVVGPPPALS